MQEAADRNATLWFLWATGVYFALQMIQRLMLGGALEADEAEMLLLGRDWAWGYGPQPPLYNWLQILVFGVMGPGTAGLILLKNFSLWLAGAGMWFAMRHAFADRRAATAAALSLAFLPNILWEFQRASSHSIVLLVAICWTLWAWFRLMARQDLLGWLVLGVIMGLGGLSKWNYWAVPAGLMVASIGFWPQRVQVRGAATAVVVAALIVAAPYYWAVTHTTNSLASVYKFYNRPVMFPWALGVDVLAANVLAGMALPLIIGGGLWAFVGRGRLGPAPTATRLLWRAAVMTVAVTAVLVIAFGITNIQARWLVPILIFASAAGFGWLGPALSAPAFRAVPALAATCAAITVLGMAQVRNGSTATRDLSPLSNLITQLQPDRIEAGYYLAGNLKLLHPELDIKGTGATAIRGDWPQRLLIFGDMPPGLTPLDGGELQLASSAANSDPFRVRWHIVAPPG